MGPLEKEMKVARTSMTLSLLAFAVVASPLAKADDAAWYAGVNVGQSRATIDNPRITRGLLQSGFSTTSIRDDEHDLGYKLYGGYSFNKYWALEGGYFNMGEFGFTANTMPQGTLDGRIKLQGVFLDVVGTVPLTEKFSIFGRVGVNYARARDTFTGTGSVNVLDPHPRTTGTNYKFGVGLQYALTESLSVRAEAERYRIDDAVGNKGDVDLVSVGLLYRFGAQAAAPVAPVVTPPPVDCSTLDDDHDGVNNCDDKCPATAAGTIVGPDGCPQKVVIDLRGVNFKFDRPRKGATDIAKSLAEPTADSISVLNQAVDTLQRYPQVHVTVAGYTDSKGTDAYNQSLSERRAKIVYDYLTSHGIDGSRLEGPIGHGENNPIGDNATDAGRAQNRRTELQVQQ
jgi:outer membrane protein OmpA-like peptidoglycan-associated protein/opacity protein-like surface antigen